MNDNFTIIKTPLNMQLLTEAIAWYYPMQTIIEEGVNGNDDEIVTVHHANGNERSKRIMQYISLNNPNPEKVRKKSSHHHCLES